MHIKGVLPRLVRRVRGAGTRDFCPALAVLIGPVLNSFLTGHYFCLFLPIAQQAEQAVATCGLSLI
jgi:hypothetical protein